MVYRVKVEIEQLRPDGTASRGILRMTTFEAGASWPMDKAAEVGVDAMDAHAIEHEKSPI